MMKGIAPTLYIYGVIPDPLNYCHIVDEIYVLICFGSKKALFGYTETGFGFVKV